MAWDVIVVGARVAGSATAMLLARQGLRVLVVDRVSFPKDTVSSHQVHLPGVARLNRWGLLGRLPGTPPTRLIRFDAGDVVLTGTFPEHEGVDALYSPRRTRLDTVLVDAARRAGAEVRENVRVEELIWRDGRVTGVRASHRGSPVVETARLVVGADGKRSSVAAAAGAPTYWTVPPRSFASYTYWSGVPVAGGELYQRPGRAVAVFPTDDDLTMVYVAAPLAGFDRARADLEAHYLATLDRCGDLGARVRAGTRVERIRTTPDQPNTFRRPYGPGWALVGDAGAVMDSVSAQGISNALRDAERLAEAIVAGLGGSRPLRDALAAHEWHRNRALKGMYEFTLGLAEHTASPRQRMFLAELADRPDQIPGFLGTLAGVTPPDTYFSARTAWRLFGGRTVLRLAAADCAADRAARPAERDAGPSAA